ncbi:DNA polymerase I [Candidatus Dojkabacteria bacterium]|nr:DNA polymerase I [Candidatus Dojkabacteria bacterium]
MAIGNTSNNKDAFLLIDVHALVHRAYHAYPAHLRANGLQTNAVYGFTSMLLEVIDKFKPKYLVACIDEGKSTERLKIYPKYKATRKPTDQELLDQLPIVHEVLGAFDVPMFGKEGYEADDLIGTVVNDPKINGGLEKIIVTGDKDIFQLVDDDTKVYLSGSAFSKSKLYDAKEVKKKMGFGPEYVVDYKALRGDPSDNIPGVRGIGEKGAQELLASFGHLDEILKNIEKIETKRLKTALEKGVEEAEMSAELATIFTDIPIDFDLKKAQFSGLDTEDVIAILKKYRFHSLLKKLPNGGIAIDKPPARETAVKGPQMGFDALMPSENPEKTGSSTTITPKNDNYQIVTEESIEELLKDLAEASEFAFDTETDSLDYMNANLIGFSVSLKEGEAYYVSKKLFDKYNTEIRKIFESERIRKIGHNIKFDIHVLLNQGIGVEGVHFDTMIAAYLIKAGVGEYGLKRLAMENFGMKMLGFKELMKLSERKGDIKGIPLEELGHYACADADATWRLYQLYSEQMAKQPELKSLLEEVEMPLVEVLIEMERNGIGLNVAYLEEFRTKLDKRLAELKEDIIKFAGVEFNLNSPKQLSEVLFGKLGLTGTKKTSSGAFSTNERVLRDLREQHEIVGLILEYREVSKLRSTYTDALIEQKDPVTGRVHSSFNQSVASTGRLSSSEPNLQNIPAASEMGNKIRKAFEAGKGKIFVSLDYSQQELRILSSVSRDKILLDTYDKNVDVHTLTASRLFDKPIDHISKTERAQGKTINFSLIYGISAFGLADRLKISQSEAQGLIDRYFQTYEGVRKFFDKLLQDAKTDGVIETKLGRRRDVSEINSRNFRIKNALERETINFPIQGGASDMMKLAMINVWRELKKSEWAEYKLILQIHDELVFEVPFDRNDVVIGKIKNLEDIKDEKLRKFIEMVREAMLEANMYELPMKVDVGVGKSWGEIKEL